MRHTHVYVYKVVHINILLGIERLKSKRNTYWYPFFLCAAAVSPR